MSLLVRKHMHVYASVFLCYVIIAWICILVFWPHKPKKWSHLALRYIYKLYIQSSIYLQTIYTIFDIFTNYIYNLQYIYKLYIQSSIYLQTIYTIFDIFTNYIYNQKRCKNDLKTTQKKELKTMQKWTFRSNCFMFFDCISCLIIFSKFRFDRIRF